MSAVFSLCACLYGRHVTERSKQRDSRKMRCVSERRTAADRMYTDGRCNDLYVKADRGHILISHDLLSSYHTALHDTIYKLNKGPLIKALLHSTSEGTLKFNLTLNLSLTVQMIMST